MPRPADTRSPLTSGQVRPYDVARWCAAQGWPVHPLAAGRKTPAANCADCRDQRHDPHACSCLPAGRWCHGFHAATTDSERLDAWWGTDHGFGVGVSCGPAGLLVIDVDAHSDQVPARDRLLPGIRIHDKVDLNGLTSGFDTLALLAAYRGQPNPCTDTSTLRVRTPSGGLHIWYRTNEEFRSSTGSSTKVALAWQNDVRAHGGYIVAPLTRTPHGTYLPVDDVRQPAPLPTWLAAELKRTGHQAATEPAPELPVPKHRRSPTAAGRTLAPLLDQVRACAAVQQGASFTEKLNRAAFTAGGLVAAGHLREHDVLSLLDAAAHEARPGQRARNDHIIADALAAGARRPLHLKGRP
ncbi:bifunctional DNA primase/polymerase [Kitasatospora sp. NPDC059973]|uniref:bifunctional DNA primase/polymerase n=1 Tax=Kitasatospora sp. NPDC059973 TaxID=3347020 RepID=UPI00368199DD